MCILSWWHCYLRHKNLHSKWGTTFSPEKYPPAHSARVCTVIINVYLEKLFFAMFRCSTGNSFCDLMIQDWKGKLDSTRRCWRDEDIVIWGSEWENRFYDWPEIKGKEREGMKGGGHWCLRNIFKIFGFKNLVA